jgi:hypothetical protein
LALPVTPPPIRSVFLSRIARRRPSGWVLVLRFFFVSARVFSSEVRHFRAAVRHPVSVFLERARVCLPSPAARRPVPRFLRRRFPVFQSRGLGFGTTAGVCLAFLPRRRRPGFISGVVLGLCVFPPLPEPRRCCRLSSPGLGFGFRRSLQARRHCAVF